MLPSSRNKMAVLGKATAEQIGNIPPQEFSSHSFSQQYLATFGIMEKM